MSSIVSPSGAGGMTRGGPRSSATASAVLYAARPKPPRSLSGSSAATMSAATAMARSSVEGVTGRRAGVSGRAREQLVHIDIMRIEWIGRIATGLIARGLAELARRNTDDPGEGAQQRA